ncbi:MAG: hypothetical protein J5757_09170 [Lachnospiraceae bacterium]|nr:hypothetical protein [Lachnospiraceae bacterium]
MRKRMTALALAACMLFTWTACDNGSKTETQAPESSASAETKATDAEVTTTAKPAETEATTVAPTTAEATTQAPTTEEVTEVPTEAPTEALDMAKVSNAYLAILRQYESQIKDVENQPSLKTPSCALGDINGDGIPELIFQYGADVEEAGRVLTAGFVTIVSVRIFSYDPENDTAYEVLHFPRSIINAGGRISSDLLVTDENHLLITHVNHSGDDSEDYMCEYVFADRSFGLVNKVMEKSILADERTYTFNTTYTLNDAEITKEKYDSLCDAYRASAVTSILYDPIYDEGRGGDWGAKVKALPTCRYRFDDLVKLLSEQGIL